MAHAHRHHGADRVVTGAVPTQKGLDVNLPAQTSTPPDDPALGPNQIVLDYSAAREISVNHEVIKLGELEARLRITYGQRKDKTMFIMAAGSLA